MERIKQLIALGRENRSQKLKLPPSYCDPRRDTKVQQFAGKTCREILRFKDSFDYLIAQNRTEQQKLQKF